MSGESVAMWLEETWHEHLALRVRVTACRHESTSPFQRIAVYDSVPFGRILTLGGRIALTEHDAATYSEGLAHPALRCHPAPRRVLIVGGGDGGICREVLRYRDVEAIDVVEIDHDLVDVVRRHFPDLGAAFDDPRVHLACDDAHRFLAAADARWDVIIVDADTLLDPAADLVERVPLTRLLARALAEDGILIAPLGVPGCAAADCRRAHRRLTRRFATTRVYRFATESMLGQPWAVAWCSPTRSPDPVSPAPACTGPLRFWSPVLHPALFALPEDLRDRLGLAEQ